MDKINWLVNSMFSSFAHKVFLSVHFGVLCVWMEDMGEYRTKKEVRESVKEIEGKE